jgi:hypothetical protein
MVGEHGDSGGGGCNDQDGNHGERDVTPMLVLSGFLDERLDKRLGTVLRRSFFA